MYYYSPISYLKSIWRNKRKKDFLFPLSCVSFSYLSNKRELFPTTITLSRFQTKIPHSQILFNSVSSPPQISLRASPFFFFWLHPFPVSHLNPFTFLIFLSHSQMSLQSPLTSINHIFIACYQDMYNNNNVKTQR